MGPQGAAEGRRGQMSSSRGADPYLDSAHPAGTHFSVELTVQWSRRDTAALVVLSVCRRSGGVFTAREKLICLHKLSRVQRASIGIWVLLLERRKVKWADKFLIISAWEWSPVYQQPSCARSG